MRRACWSGPAELRALDDDGALRIEGVAMRYGAEGRGPGGRPEVFEPGSLMPSANGVILNWAHERAQPLARSPGGGMELDDSPERLAVRATLSDTSAARDAWTLVRDGVAGGLSIEFIPVAETARPGGVRTISKAHLVGIAIVDVPAYPDSGVSARAEAAGRRRRYFL